MLCIYHLVAQYIIEKALKLYTNVMAIMTKDEFDKAQLINVNKTNSFYR